MRATVMYGVHDVRVETVPDAKIIEPTDALVRVTRACICGSDLWPYNSMPASETGNRMGHEFIGVVESVGSDVRTVKKGDLVVAPFAWSDGTCFARERCTAFSPLRCARFSFGFIPRASVRLGSLRCAPVQDLSSCLTYKYLSRADRERRSSHKCLLIKRRQFDAEGAE